MKIYVYLVTWMFTCSLAVTFSTHFEIQSPTVKNRFAGRSLYHGNWQPICHQLKWDSPTPLPLDPMRGLPGDPEIWWAATALLGENHVEVGNVHVWIIIPSVYQPTGSSSSTLFNTRCLTTYYQSRMSMHIFDTWSGDRGKWVKQLVNNLVCFMVISQPLMLPSHMPWRASSVSFASGATLYWQKSTNWEVPSVPGCIIPEPLKQQQSWPKSWVPISPNRLRFI